MDLLKKVQAYELNLTVSEKTQDLNTTLHKIKVSAPNDVDISTVKEFYNTRCCKLT